MPEIRRQTLAIILYARRRLRALKPCHSPSDLRPAYLEYRIDFHYIPSCFVCALLLLSSVILYYPSRSLRSAWDRRDPRSA